MKESGSFSLQDFFRELKRRRVFRVAAVYAVAGSAVVEVAVNVSPLLQLPEWTPALVLVLVLLGIPFALGLTWAFDLTPHGLQRTRPVPDDAAAGEAFTATPPATGKERGAAATSPDALPKIRGKAGRIAVLGAVAVLALAGAAMLFTGVRGAAVVENRVAVLPFDNGTGDASLDDLGAVAADWISDGLASHPGLEVIPTITVAEALSASAGVADPIRVVARTTGAGLLVTGSYVIRGDSLEVRSQLVEMPQGRVVGSVDAARTDRSSPTAAFGSVRAQIVGRVAARLDAYGELAGDFDPPSYEAYRPYIAGKERFWAFRFTEAIEMFDLALAADPDFLGARAWIAACLWQSGEFARMDSVLQLAEAYRPQASSGEGLVLDWLQAELGGDRGSAYRLSRELFRRVPTSMYRYIAALAAQQDNRPREAIELYQALSEREVIRQRWPIFHDNLALAYHDLGEFQQELQVAREARSRFPGVAGPVFNEARALAALDRAVEAQAVLRELTTLPDASEAHWLQVHGGLELRRHGHADAGNANIRDALAWLLSHDSLSHRYAIARTRLWLGEPEAALPQFRLLAADDPANVHYLGYLGLALAASGQTAEAHRIDTRLAQWSERHARGDDLYWRAAIAAMLGELDYAMALLEDAVARGYGISRLIENEDLRPLWDHPPFQRLIEPKG